MHVKDHLLCVSSPVRLPDVRLFINANNSCCRYRIADACVRVRYARPCVTIANERPARRPDVGRGGGTDRNVIAQIRLYTTARTQERKNKEEKSIDRSKTNNYYRGEKKNGSATRSIDRRFIATVRTRVPISF